MRKWLVIILLFSMGTAMAQSVRSSEYNDIGWYVFTGSVKLKKNWRVLGEFQFRRTHWGGQWQQSLLRAGGQYQFSPQLKVRAGYAWIVTFPYGDNSINSLGRSFPEHRIYQVVQTETSSGKFRFSNRYMLEQRFLGYFHSVSDMDPYEYRMSWRARGLWRAETNIGYWSKGKMRTYIAAWDEIFIGFGKNVKENIFDQNRIALVAGIQPNPHFRLEGGLFEQIVQLGREVNSQNVFQYNTGLNISANLEF